MAAPTPQYEGIILGLKPQDYLVRLVDLIHDQPDVLSWMRREAFPEEHRYSLEPGALFFWTVDQECSKVQVADMKV